MDYNLALGLGKAAYIGMWLASGYYFFRTALTFTVKQPSLAGLKGGLQYIVQNGRILHPYIGLAVLLLFPYHGYTMFNVFGITPKTVLGIGTSLTALVTITLGLTLWSDRSKMPVRKLHRWSMFLLLAVSSLHVVLKV